MLTTSARRERFVAVGAQVLVHRHLRRRHQDRRFGPDLLERGKRAPLHVRLLHDDEASADRDAALRPAAPRESHVLAGVGRRFSTSIRSRGHAMPRGNRGELTSASGVVISCRVIEPESARQDQQRRHPLQEQLGAALGHARVVAAQHHDRVGGGKRVAQMVVVPEHLREADGRDRPVPAAGRSLKTSAPRPGRSRLPLLARRRAARRGRCRGPAPRRRRP